MNKSRPMPFTPSSIASIRRGEKTHTRRVVIPRDIIPGSRTLCWENQTIEELQHVARCRYGEVGDQLWTREPWRVVDVVQDEATVKYVDGQMRSVGLISEVQLEQANRWKNKGDSLDAFDKAKGRPKIEHWHTSRFMPRWASRDTLKITAVRLEQLCRINNVDCIAEGIRRRAICQCGEPLSVCDKHGEVHVYSSGTRIDREERYLDPRGAFEVLWNACHGDGAFAKNPIVWAIGLQRLTQ